MKLSELIERLEEIRDELAFVHGERFDPEVLGAYQAWYPLAGVVLGAAASEADQDNTEKATVWIAIGGPPATGSAYAPRDAFEEAR